MKKKLAFWNSLVIILSVSFMLALGIFLARNTLINEATSHTISLTHAYKEAFTGDTSSLVVKDENVRETIILSNGDVLWDSEEDASKLASHKNREEVIAALNDEPKAVIRSSESVGIKYIYYAETKEISSTIYIIRIATKMSSLNSFLSSYIPWMVLAATASLSLSILGIFTISSHSLKPLKEMEMNLSKIKKGEQLSPILFTEHDELGNMLKDIDDISKDLSDTMNKLKQEEEKMSLLLSNLPNPILAIGKGNEIVFANDAAKTLLGLIGNIFPKNIVLKDQEMFQKGYDGKIYFVSSKEAKDYTLYVLNDITVQMEMEKQRKEFVDAASHELKTPLTSIRGFNELIELSSDNPKIKEYTTKIKESSTRMLSVIQDMLSISSLEEEKVTDAKEINVAPIVEEIIKRLSLMAKERKVKVSLKGDIKLKVEEKDIERIFKNLLENAILYNVPNGKVDVSFTKDFVEISDTGIGIPEKDQERVFERFYRVDKSHSRQNGGTGLGLAIVKHAVLKYNWKIKLTSRLGYGTTIKIFFN